MPALILKRRQHAAAAAPAAPAPTQYLTFVLAGELFAIGILAVKEIIEYQGLTAVPMMPPSVRGVINLRGAAVPVMDLLARLGCPSSPIGRKTCIVIVETQVGAQRRVLGVVVDAVNEVLDIAAADIEPPPAFGARVRADFLHGMGKVKGRFVMLLDVDRVLCVDTIGSEGTAPLGTPAAASQTAPTNAADAAHETALTY